jgi:uncharacterized protein YbjT (DUF2867 family)
MRTAMVIGATGLVGGHLTEQLCADSTYDKVVVLSRRKLEQQHPKIEVRVIDFDKPDPAMVKADDVFCAIGTTLKKAGSKENQYRIDCEYPAKLAALAKQNGTETFVLVSSIGADAASGNFYLRTKGELEEKLKQTGFKRLIILRPSFILGDRKEFRAGEKIGILLAKALKSLMVGKLRKYRGVQATAIAAKMIAAAKQTGSAGTVVISSEEI